MIAEVKEWIAARLSESQPFAGPPPVTVVAQRRGDWLSRMQSGLAEGGVGLALVVTHPILEKQPSGRLHFKALIPIHVWENVPLNDGPGGLQIPAENACLAVMAVLAGIEPAGGWTPLQPVRMTPADNTKDGIVMFEVVMETTITFRPVPQ